MTFEQKNNINHKLNNCYNMLAFLSVATVSLLEGGSVYSSPIINGADDCLSHLQNCLKSAIAEFEEVAL